MSRAESNRTTAAPRTAASPESPALCEIPGAPDAPVVADTAETPRPPEPPHTAWEAVVAQAWARALGLEPEAVGRDRDFIALGGDAAAAQAVVAIMTTELDIPADQVGVATLREAPTVAQFARRVVRRPDRRTQTLTVLRADGEAEPLVLVAGGGALGVGFVPMVRHLPRRRPVYTLHSQALERVGLPDWSVRAAARRNVRTLRRLQPRGPYNLGGHSFGGIVALEMAHQLRAAGQEVGLLAIIDSIPPDPALLPALPERSLSRRARDVIGLAVTGFVPTPGRGQYWRFHRQNVFLSSRYRCAPYDGRAVVLLTDGDEHHEHEQWPRHLSGDARIVPIPGDHHSVLRDPDAAGVAHALAAALGDEPHPSTEG